MKNNSKKFIAVSLSFFLFLFLTIYSSENCYAATGTIGSEKPSVTFEFKDSNGKIADGNNLSAGTYSVDVNLSGMANISIFQMSASYTSVVTDLSVTSMYNGNMKTAGPVIRNGEIILGLYSTNNDTTAIDSNGTALATLSVTVSSACDFADVFMVNNDPNYSFIQADYGDGYNMSYVPGIETQTGDYFPMNYDVSPTLPANSFDIKGTVKVATSLDGDTTTGGIIGITVSVTDGINSYSAVTDKDGLFTISQVPVGSYDVTISGPTTIDRTATLTVSADKAVDGVITVNDVGIVICDYNKDTYINGVDTGLFSFALSVYDVNMDINCDSFVTGVDVGLYSSFVGIIASSLILAK